MIGITKARLAASAATMALTAGGLGMMGTLTAAATPSCGRNCVDLYSHKYGPSYFIDTFHGQAAKDQEVILFQGSNSDPAEDFTFRFSGRVHSFYAHHRGLVTAAFDHTYGHDPAVEIRYSPSGRNSNLCLSTWPGVTPQPGYKVRLEPCGMYSNSLWVIDLGTRGAVITDHKSALGHDAPLINGADSSFSDPLVMNYPAGNPTDQPRPWLNVQPEATYSDNTVFDNQEWGLKVGPLSSSLRLHPRPAILPAAGGAP